MFLHSANVRRNLRRNNMNTKFCAKPDGKLHYPHTILTGFAFLASSIAWAIYDPFVTKILNRLLQASPTITHWSSVLSEKLPFLVKFSATQGDDVAALGLVPLFIGIIMTFDNIFGVIFQPTFGKISDRTHSKMGKRKPYIVFGAPASALFFALIPVIAIKTGSLPLTMVCIILYVFIMSLWRAPCVALMPDLCPNELRSEGNAIINLVGGVGSVVGMVAGTIVTAVYCLVTGIDKKSDAFDELNTFPYVFLLGAVVMIICTLVVYFTVKEPDSRLKAVSEAAQAADEAAKAKAEKEAAKAEKEALKAEKLSGAERKSLIFMMGCLFFLFCGTNAVTTFFALFADEILHKTASEATLMATALGAAVAVGAIPAGWLGKHLGRKKTIILGLIIYLAAFGSYIFAQDILHSVPLMNVLIWVALIVGGFGQIFITVNTLPLVLEIGGINKVGVHRLLLHRYVFGADCNSHRIRYRCDDYKYVQDSVLLLPRLLHSFPALHPCRKARRSTDHLRRDD